jgi:predicted metal-dependent phosphotriesterase family hydrolase
MRMFIALLLKNGIGEREIELMAKINPAKLLDLD